MKPLLLTFVLVGLALPLHAQSSRAGYGQDEIPPLARTVSLAGPRFGFTSLSDGVVDTLKQRDIFVGHAISQFGCQFEQQFYNMGGDGPTVLNEWVILAGGLDQGVVLPSANWLVGLRTHDGAEFGVGPNITPAGVALAIAAGVTFRAGVLNIPMNFAVVPSKNGMRVSMLTGFTLRR
jgi:hypothetical protein